MRVLFPYPREFGYFPDIYEYVTLLRERNIEAYYVGIQNSRDGSNNPPYAIHLAEGGVSKIDFINFVSEQIVQIKPDIVHTYHFRGCGILPLKARKSAQKWIVDVRTIHVETQGLKIKSDFWIRDRLTWLETQTYNYIFALTDLIRKKLSPSLRPVEIVPLGANAHRLNPVNKEMIRAETREKLNIPIDAPVILYAGSLSPTRHLDKVIKAFALVNGIFPNVKLLIVGGEPGQNPAVDSSLIPLRQLTEQLSISESVLFTGRVPYSGIPGFLATADIGISYMPCGTPHQYQPPTKLIEYMMAGMVAASNDIPAVRGIVEDNVDGILFGESEEEIAHGLRRSLEFLNPQNLDAYFNLTTNAAKAVLDRDWNQIVDKRLIPRYEKLCEKQV